MFTEIAAVCVKNSSFWPGFVMLCSADALRTGATVKDQRLNKDETLSPKPKSIDFQRPSRTNVHCKKHTICCMDLSMFYLRDDRTIHFRFLRIGSNNRRIPWPRN